MAWAIRWKGEVIYETEKENRVALLLHWAGGQKVWLFLAILLAMCGGLCIIVPYIGIYRLMDATFNNTCTKELVVQAVTMITGRCHPPFCIVRMFWRGSP